MKLDPYVDDDLPQKLVTWGKAKKGWGRGHAVYHEPALELAQPLYRYMKAADAFRTLETKTLWFSSAYEMGRSARRMVVRPSVSGRQSLGRRVSDGSCWTRRYRDEPILANVFMRVRKG
jgi:hypothetical protein